ncbi:MAG TPA: molybdopterin-binding protein, partial [Thermomicrobiales bacterium]|nr:molybdopterin-binding protein [Thermomicrobiales bacterium]
MRAQILSIGDELLGGYITDTNATWLEQQLALLNISVDQVTHVGDNLDRLVVTLQRAIGEADLVICTGGVGPTEDDLTREAIAAALGEVPVVDPQLLDGIRSFFAGRNLTMPERNAKQAWQIPSSVPLHNSIGTAPGWFVQYGETAIAAMPGVPREMFLMYQEQLLPRLQSLRAGTVIRSTTLKTIGIGESLAEEKLHDIIRRSDPVIATYAKDDGVHIRVTASADNEASAIAHRDACVSEIAARIGETIYGRDAITL